MSLTLTKAVSPRDHAITEFSNKLSHVNGKRWLQESELKTEEIHALHSKFKDNIFQLFRCIEVFSPGEALVMKKEMLLAFSSATLEVKAPTQTGSWPWNKPAVLQRIISNCKFHSKRTYQQQI